MADHILLHVETADTAFTTLLGAPWSIGGHRYETRPSGDNVVIEAQRGPYWNSQSVAIGAWCRLNGLTVRTERVEVSDG